MAINTVSITFPVADAVGHCMLIIIINYNFFNRKENQLSFEADLFNCSKCENKSLANIKR